MLSRRGLRIGMAHSALAIALLVVACAVGMFTVAGSRRTASAFDRFVEWSRPADVSTGGAQIAAPTAPLLDRIERLPEVAAYARTYSVSLLDATLPGDVVLRPPGIQVGAVDDRFGRDLERFRIVDGALPSPDDATGALTDLASADRFDLHVGDQITLRVATSDGAESRTVIRVAGIVATAGAFPTVGGFSISGLYLTSAFVRAHPEMLDPTQEGLSLRLVHGEAGRATLDDELHAAGIDGLDLIEGIGAVRAGTNKVTGLESSALLIAGAVGVAVALVVLVQVLRRQAELLGDRLVVFGQIGVRRREVVAAAALRGASLGFGAGAVAIAVAVAASPLAPVGLARVAEIDVGFHADVPVLAIGFALAVVSGAALSAIVVALETRRARDERPSPSASSFALPVALRAGLAVLLGGSGRARPRLRLLWLCLPVALAATVLIARDSVDHLTTDARVSGGSWDAFINSDEIPIAESMAATLEDRSLVAGWSPGGWDALTIAGTPVFSLLIDPGRGIQPAIVSGRAPSNDGEVALGAATMRAAHTSIGEEVALAYPDAAGDSTAPPVHARVVGEALVSSTLFQNFAPDASAVVPVGLAARLGVVTTSALLTFASNTDAQRGLDAVLARAPPGAVDFAFARSTRGDVFALRRLVGLATSFELALVAMAIVVLAYQFATRTRRAHRDLGALRAIGCTRRQLMVIGASTGAIVATTATVIGLPLGVVAGKAAWNLAANQMEVLPRPTIRLDLLAPMTISLLIVPTLAAGALTRRANHLLAAKPLRTSD